MRLVSAAARGLRRAGVAILRATPPLTRDAVGIAGASMIVFGVWQMHRPSAWIVAGLMIVGTVWRLSRPAKNGESA